MSPLILYVCICIYIVTTQDSSSKCCILGSQDCSQTSETCTPEQNPSPNLFEQLKELLKALKKKLKNLLKELKDLLEVLRDLLTHSSLSPLGAYLAT